MQFDITIGNPPFKDIYSGRKEVDMYGQFIHKMLDLNPRFTSFIIPSKWLTNSKRPLKDLRKRLVSDGHLRVYTDYMDSFFILETEERVPGGCGFFLYDKEYTGNCIFAHFGDDGWNIDEKDLRKHNIIARDELFQSILDKVSGYALKHTDELEGDEQPKYLSDILSQQGFVILDNINASSVETITFDTKVYTKDQIVYIVRDNINGGQDLLPYYSVLIGIGEKSTDMYGGVHTEIVTRIKKPMEAASKYYMVLGKFNTCLEAFSLESYLNTDIIKFLIYKITLDSSFDKQTLKDISLVPFDRMWSNSDLAVEFGIDNNELKYVAGILEEQQSQEEYEE